MSWPLTATGEPTGTTACTGAVTVGAGIEALNCGNVAAADRQSGQPARHTSELPPTRPSLIQARIMSPEAGPNWPPDEGRTYQTALGASAIGSLVAADAVAAAAAPARATADGCSGRTRRRRAGLARRHQTQADQVVLGQDRRSARFLFSQIVLVRKRNRQGDSALWADRSLAGEKRLDVEFMSIGT